MSSFAKGFGGCLGVFAAICCLGIGGCVFVAFLASQVDTSGSQPGGAAIRPPAAADPAKKPNPPQANIQPQPDEPQNPKWAYRETKDGLTDALVQVSSLQSKNTIDLKFPYQGEQRATILLRNKQGQIDVIFSIERGQLFPNALLSNEAVANVRIDDALIQCPIVRTTGMQTETIFLNSPQLPSLIAAGRELRIEVELFQESNQVFVFDLTSGR